MSHLDRDKSAFKAALAAASDRIGPVKSAVLAIPSVQTLAPPSPSPSIGSTASKPDGGTSTGNTPGKKRKREIEVYSQPASTGGGDNINTQTWSIVDYLRTVKPGDAKTLDVALDHSAVYRADDARKELLAQSLRRHPHVEWHPDPQLSEQTWATGTYTYKPKIPNVRTAEALLSLLQQRTDSTGISMKDLKDGWPDCRKTLDGLATQHRIRLMAIKNDELIWLDDPSLCHSVSAELQAMFRRVPLPAPEKLPGMLRAAGHKPASEDPKVEAAAPKQKQQKKRKTNKSVKTNTHMEHLLLDYSHLQK